MYDETAKDIGCRYIVPHILTQLTQAHICLYVPSNLLHSSSLTVRLMIFKHHMLIVKEKENNFDNDHIEIVLLPYESNSDG